MSAGILKTEIRVEHDVVLARQRARQISALLGFEVQDQVRIATAVSEIARNVYRYAKPGMVEFTVTEAAPFSLEIRITDRGRGIPDLTAVLEGRYVSQTGMGMGITGARKLMDDFQIQSSPAGTSVILWKTLPRRSLPLKPATLADIAEQLARQAPQDPFEELQRQNQELLSTLHELQRQKTELAQLNRELEDTNRGVVALYAELDERADYLRRASEMKTQFLSNMTHEFRTPLNSILSLSRLLLDRVDGALTPEQEKQVTFIKRAADELSALVNDLLDLARVEAGKVKLQPAEFTVQDLFGALRGMLRPLLAHNSAVTLTFDAPQDLPALHTDESKVSQVLRNLISNALKYTEHGEVRVSASRASGPASDSADWMCFSVEDTGIGIVEADQERIFEEFTQIEGPHQTGKHGTGLGLPLSRKLAELLGGTLRVRSEVGEGSTFTLRVPVVYKGPETASFVPEISAEVDPLRYPVLVVEDNRETLFVYEKYFKGTGYQPIPSRTLKEAREAFTRFRPVAIILDIILSHESAWSFLTECKEDPDRRQIPIIVITMIENEHKAMAMGADAFHTKPVDRLWLLNQIEKVTGTKDRDQVLLVDDDEAARYVLKSLLAETRFAPVEAGSGTEGLALARKLKPAAIFLDLLMPGMDGPTFLTHLRSDPELKDIPVIIHTCKALTPRERKALEAKSVAVLNKRHDDRQRSARVIRDALLQVVNTAPAQAQLSSP